MTQWNARTLDARTRDGLTRLFDRLLTAQLGHPADSITLTTTPLLPGPVDALVRIDNKLVQYAGWTPVIAWARDPMILTVQLDGTPSYDYSATPMTKEQMTDLPVWVFDSIAAAGPELSKHPTLSSLQKFADRWELEWLDPLEVGARLEGHFLDEGAPGLQRHVGKDASTLLRALRDDLPDTL